MNGTSFQSDIRYWLRKGNTVNHLLFWNIVIFLVVNILRLIAYVTHQANPYVWTLNELSLTVPFNNFIRQPWGLFTYMFTHQEIFHLLFNMLNLYWFGNLFRDFLGDKRVLPLYLMGGLSGGLLYLLSASLITNTFMAFPLIGASASVMCILVAAATLMPNYEIGLMFFGSVKLKWLAIALIALGLISIPDGNAGGMISHMGGALFGFLYIRILQAGTDLCKPLIWVFNSKNRSEERKAVAKKFKPKKSPLKVVKKADDTNPSRLDQLLDKINEKGYNSLSAEEKAWLEKVSKEN